VCDRNSEIVTCTDWRSDGLPAAVPRLSNSSDWSDFPDASDGAATDTASDPSCSTASVCSAAVSSAAVHVPDEPRSKSVLQVYLSSFTVEWDVWLILKCCSSETWLLSYRVATNLENLEYSGISLNMENSGNSHGILCNLGENCNKQSILSASFKYLCKTAVDWVNRIISRISGTSACPINVS